jgi:hypothetical protein
VRVLTDRIDDTIQGRSRFVVDAQFYKRFIAAWQASREEEWTSFWYDLARLHGRVPHPLSDGDGDLSAFSNFPLKLVNDDVIATPFVGAVLAYASKPNSIPHRFIRQLVLRREYRGIVQEFKRRHFGGKRVVGIHVRHGNGERGDFAEKQRQIADLSKLLDNVERAITTSMKATLGEISVFLCTDSDIVVAEVEKRIPNLITRPQWRPQANTGCSLHLGHLCPGGKIENAANAAIDMFLLGSCDYLAQVGEGSWFTKVAARLVGDERIILVETDAANIDDHVFACGELPSAVKSCGIGRASVGKGGHLVYGPYIRIDKENRYCAELNYLTTSCPGPRAGIFEVIVSRRDQNKRHVDFKAIGSINLPPTNNRMHVARVEFDTTGASGMLLELRVHVENDVAMQAFHIRTRRLANAGSQTMRARIGTAVRNFNWHQTLTPTARRSG